ncbi:MAG: hypothetical protein ACRYG2_17495 [Janthinobacterium lividum]
MRRLDQDRRWTSEALVSLPARSASPGVELARRGGLALVPLTVVTSSRRPRPSAGRSGSPRRARTPAPSSRTCSPPARAWRWGSARSPPAEVGRAPGEVEGERVIAVVRNKTLRRSSDPAVATLRTGDQVVVVRKAPDA